MRKLEKRIGKCLGYKVLLLLPALIWLAWLIVMSADFNGEALTSEFSRRVRDVGSRHPRAPVQDDGEVPPGAFDFSAMVNANATFRLPTPRGLKRDWHDYDAMAADKQRVGLGEQGEAVRIVDESLRELEQNMSLANGFNAMVSDNISVNRSLPEARREDCLHQLYLANLPRTSIVIPFYNEHLSVLQRTLHSIVNRTPPELLKEIIIVDDFSDRANLREELEDYLRAHFRRRLVKVVRLPQRTGLIGARVAGARRATGEVLVFFDSHVECNHNWLPPLLEPIVLNRKISTCPIIDVIANVDFGYIFSTGKGSRGYFDWNMEYAFGALLPSDKEPPTHPYRNAVMMGGLFAIERKFFWELGGYDDQLDIWGGEQYELSFKIWMCGGMLIDVPCSHVAHVFRGPMNRPPNHKNGTDFLANNMKRIGEVWMDEYSQYIYKRDRSRYVKAKTGDISAQLAVRKRMQCKSFKWFLEVVAPDQLQRFPPVAPPSYALGAVQSVAYSTLCLDTMNHKSGKPVGLYYCAQNKTNPQENQFWDLSYARDMRAYDKYCLDVQSPNTTVWMWHCHKMGGNQFWYYDREHQWLVQGNPGQKCMEAVRTKDGEMLVHANKCDAANSGMKWLFGSVNDTALDNFYDNAEKNNAEGPVF